MTRCEETGMGFYVYSHTDKNGDVFYIGKGKGDRAWDRNKRHELWQRYLENINHEYIVTVVEKDLDEDAAFEVEEKLIRQHEETIVNWFNSNRHGDWRLIARYWELRKADDVFHANARAMEKVNLEEAVSLYRQEITMVRDYLSVLEDYYASEVSKFKGMTRKIYQDYYMKTYVSVNDLRALDRLTMCLKKLKRVDEARDDVRRFFEDYPTSERHSTATTIKKRIGGF